VSEGSRLGRRPARRRGLTSVGMKEGRGGDPGGGEPPAEGKSPVEWRPLTIRLAPPDPEAPEGPPKPSKDQAAPEAPAEAPEPTAAPEKPPKPKSRRRQKRTIRLPRRKAAPRRKPAKPQPARGAADSPQALLRRLRSRMPVSPLPWHWHRRINRGVVLGIAALLAGGAVASVLIQRGSGEDEEAAPKLAVSAPVRAELQGLSLREKAGLVVLAGIESGSAPAFGGAAPGGYLIGPDDWAAGGGRLVKRLRAGGEKGAGAPLIVGRQEGGIYRSYPDLPPESRQIDVGASADPSLAESSAAKTAAALKGAGFDLNLAPVADVANLASPIADRAYSDDPEVVTAMTEGAVRGCRSAGIACAVSHFPGLGGASADTLDGPATVGLDAAAIETHDLGPFRAAFAAGAPATVLSLAFYAAYDPVTPAALSSSIATELLRGEVGFKGLAITDDLTSGAITAGIGSPEAAVQALAAGSDLALVDDPVEAVAARDAILAAAKSGGLAQARLDEAASRVLELKRKLRSGARK